MKERSPHFSLETDPRTEARERIRLDIEYLCDVSPKSLEEYHELRAHRRELLQTLLWNQGFTFHEQGDAHYKNLVIPFESERRGSDRKEIIIGAHYDCVRGSPGANDNTSGVALCIELARRLREKQGLLYDPKIIFFDGEENHLAGSRLYASRIRLDKRTSIQAMINLEMVGMGNKIGYFTEQACSDMIRSAQQAELNTFKTHYLGGMRADHVSFLGRGIPAMTVMTMSEEDANMLSHATPRNPLEKLQRGAFIARSFERADFMRHYHQSTDTPETIQPESIILALNFVERFMDTFATSQEKELMV